MNKNKISLIAAALLVLGVIFIGISLVCVRFDIKKISTQKEDEERTYECTQTITAIQVSDRDTNVIVKRGTGNEIKVICRENKDSKYCISEANGVLIVEKENVNQWKWFSLEFEEKKLLIEVPETFASDIEVNNNSGSIEASELAASAISLDTSDGKIVLNNVTAQGNIQLCSESGKIQAQHIKCEALQTKTSDGKTILSDINTVGAVMVEDFSAEVEAENIACDSFTTKTTDGKITLNNVVALHEINAKDSSGSINVAGLSAGNKISLETSDGAVVGSICGDESDYSIDAHTTDSSNNLTDRTGGTKELFARTNSGKILITFEQ